MIEVEWQPVPGVRALFTSRTGGVSIAPWSSCNLGDHVGDAPDAVAENRRRMSVAAALPSEPFWLRQVHSTVVANPDAPRSADMPTADAATTAVPGTVCAVLTADCLPVLLAAADGSAVGAAHAGWRGMAAGVIESTVAALRQQATPGATLLAWLGPAISVMHFEVGDDVRDAFMVGDASAAAAFRRSDNNRWHCDLYALARQRLAAVGITAVTGGDLCTYAHAHRFFSHRRDVQHHGHASTGRMASLIWRQT
jgi:YfiH family protein